MAIIKFYKNDFYEDVKKILKEGRLYDKTWETKENLKRKIKRDPQSILIAVENSKVVGCVFIVEDGWNGFIWRLCVKDEYRKKGIGSLLMKTAEEIIKKRGINESSIFVNPNNNLLIEWYKKQGYKKTSDWTFMYKKLKKCK